MNPRHITGSTVNDCVAVAAIVAAMAVLGACAAGPDFKAPLPPTETAYSQDQPATIGTGEGEGGAQRFNLEAPVLPRWWSTFDCAGLDALVERALAASPDIDMAEARLRAATADRDAQSGATRLPAVNATLSASRQRVDPAAFGFASATSPPPFDLYNASVNASYTLDLFGANRRTLEALSAQVGYQRYELEASRLTLAANVVTTAIRRAAVDAQIGATEELLMAQTQQLQIMQARRRLGGISELELRNEQLLLAQTQANLPVLAKQSEQLTHQLALYTGRPPAEGRIEMIALADLRLPAELPLILPATLARRRPDIRAAEALWHAASAQIGVATANLYPRLSLTASGGTERTNSGQLTDGLNVWSVGAQLMQPIFRGGELRARRRSAVASYDAAAAGYRLTVLQALQQVADSLTALEKDAQALAAEASAEDQAQANFQIAQRQYQLGGLSELTLLDAQRLQLQTRISRIGAEADRYADTAALLHALGGGWTDAAEPHNDAPPASGGNSLE